MEYLEAKTDSYHRVLVRSLCHWETVLLKSTPPPHRLQFFFTSPLHSSQSPQYWCSCMMECVVLLNVAPSTPPRFRPSLPTSGPCHIPHSTGWAIRLPGEPPWWWARYVSLVLRPSYCFDHLYLALFPGSCVGEEEREPSTHCLRMCQVPLVTCILLRYTKIMVNFCLPAEGRTAQLYSLWDTYEQFWSKKNNITLTVTVCNASFQVIGELQKEGLCQSCAEAFSWNGRTRRQFLQAESRVPLSLPHHCPHKMWSVPGIF